MEQPINQTDIEQPKNQTASFPTLSELPEDIRKQAEEAFLTGHYPYLLQALMVASSICQVWRLVNSDNVLTYLELLKFAKEWDETHPPKEGEFYLVTIEGAIGLCHQVEYLTHWLLTPMEPCPERDALIQKMNEKNGHQKASRG